MTIECAFATLVKYWVRTTGMLRKCVTTACAGVWCVADCRRHTSSHECDESPCARSMTDMWTELPEDVVDLGEGTFGRVRLTTMTRSGDASPRRVAVKDYGEVDDDGIPYDCVRELHVLKLLGRGAAKNHIVDAVGVAWRESGAPLPRLIMPVAHRTLREYIGTEQTMGALMKWSDELWNALTYIHSHGVVHRDLKPSNILVYRVDETVRTLALADFGSSIILWGKEPSDSLTVEGNVCTRPYAAPEMLRAEKYDATVDVWSLGMTMGELHAGKAFFWDMKTDDAVLEAYVEVLPKLVAEMPRIWQCMLEVDSARRLRTHFVPGIRSVEPLPPMPDKETSTVQQRLLHRLVETHQLHPSNYDHALQILEVHEKRDTFSDSSKYARSIAALNLALKVYEFTSLDLAKCVQSLIMNDVELTVAAVSKIEAQMLQDIHVSDTASRKKKRRKMKE